MIATQYKINLPSDYDMNRIKERVRINGHKTDGFEQLKFKLYLITEKGIHHNLQNSYCPLYLWKGNNGLNKFLFEGFYDNILNSFGWQRVNVGIPLIDTTTSNIKTNKFVYQMKGEIQPKESLNNLKERIQGKIQVIDHTEYLVIYNPDKWEYEVFYFLSDLNNLPEVDGVVYSILHTSQE
ncbi:DUF4865 family protein [Neobacillus cucumis]|uniref:DUF4865 domain-containing protein n=1 Tax=Neobacillus cucumis TaxID=1740721 RepID=A0A2N5H8M4_9BACI|nr:DUF4865 family protein [Neobacillus cucumis]PLS01872.1 DUF4865 domain-containing protein [Neobacillus cucumis]